MRSDTRDRVVLPILLPIGLLAAIALILFGFSRILLGLHGMPATVVATTVAFAILFVSAIAASRPQVRASTVGAVVGATAGVAMLAGGIAVAVVAGDEGGEPDGGPGSVVEVAAANLAFEPKMLTVPAGEAFTISLDNRDGGIQHNVAIFDNPDFSGTPIFDGEIVTGPARTEYAVEPLEAGTYFFLCVIHPEQMTGELEALEGGGEPGPAPGGLTVSAQNVAFDTDTIHLPPDAPATITFDNRDAGVQHNISIYADDTLGEILFQGEIITGPDTIDYEVGPLEAGEYYFQCDVHPNMNGTVVVDEGGGASPPPEPTGATGATGGGEGGGAQPSTVVAQGIVFDTAEISLPAGRESSLTFDNRDAGIPHNIAIYPDQNLGEPLFQGELITGPDTIEYRIPALEAGEYYFHCDVHPSMNGSVTVA